jgi:hypothetical protein
MIVRTATLAMLLICLAACASNKGANTPATQPTAGAHPVNTGIPTDIGIDSKSNYGGF